MEMNQGCRLFYLSFRRCISGIGYLHFYMLLGFNKVLIHIASGWLYI